MKTKPAICGCDDVLVVGLVRYDRRAERLTSYTLAAHAPRAGGVLASTTSGGSLNGMLAPDGQTGLWVPSSQGSTSTGAQNALRTASITRTATRIAIRRAVCASIHRLEPTDPDRQRRLPGLQPRRDAGASPTRAREFRSHLDGSLHLLTPETRDRHPGAARLGHRDGPRRMHRDARRPADAAREAMERSVAWAARARKRVIGSCARSVAASRASSSTNPGQAQFGIIQGGIAPALRTESAQATVAIGFEAYAIGGLSVGEPAGRHVRSRRPHRAAVAGRSAAISHGHRHAGRPGRIVSPAASICSTASCRRATPGTASS